MSKKYQEKAKLVEKGKLYKPEEAFGLLKQTAHSKFVETVDAAVKLNYIPKKGDSVRASINLPHGSGKSVKVAVVASPSKLSEAQAAGPHIAGGDDLIEKIQGGFLDFDVLLATPDMMPKIAKLGKLLGTKGLMPNPKSGTVTADVGKAINEFKAGKLEFRMDAGGVIHIILGKVNFEAAQLLDNLKASLEVIRKVKPSSITGNYIKSICVSASMGPGIRIDTRAFPEILQ